MKLDKLTEATMLALRGKLSEVKGSSKTYTCIEDRQHGDFCVGATMTAEEWGETAMGWADSDGWSDPEEPLLKNFKTEQDCINFIDDMWEITIVPSDSPEAKEFLGEARSHKEDNEKVAPRTVKNALGNDVETREMVDVSNPDVGNNSYKNEKGSQYWGTTHSEYASKRNKTGQKNEYGYDVYLAPFKNTGDWTIKADRMEPATATARYQYQKEQGELLKPDLKRYRDKEKRARNPENKEYWKNAADNIQRNIDDYDKKAKEIVDKEREKIANKSTETKKVTEATTDVNEVVDEYKEAYHKDLDLKTVPCVIARDKMLSGWGGAEGRNHYQVVLCADSTEAHNIASNMQAQAKREQLANVRVSFGVKLPSRASVAYCVGRNASAWNMGDNWYERYDTKKEEGKRETILGNKIVSWAYDNFKNISFVGDGKLADGSDYLKFDGNNLDEFKKALVDNFGNNIKFGTSQAQYAPEIKKLVVIIPKSQIKTEKKIEDIDENLKAYTVTVSDEENQHSFQFYAEKDKTLDDVFNEIYDYVIF